MVVGTGLVERFGHEVHRPSLQNKATGQCFKFQGAGWKVTPGKAELSTHFCLMFTKFSTRFSSIAFLVQFNIPGA